MKHLLMVTLALMVACSAMAADAPSLAPIPNMTALVAYDFQVKDLVVGASSKLLIWSVLDINVGYVTSDESSAWTGGLGVDVKGLAEKMHITYGWGAVRCGLSVYGGYDFVHKTPAYGVAASLVQF